MPEVDGWLLDLYAGSQHGIILWLATADGQRRRLSQPYPVTFYAGGPFAQLRQLWQFLRRQPVPVQLSRTQRRELGSGWLDVMAITVDAARQPRLFKTVSHCFPALDFYDADIPLSVRFAAETGVFPLTRCTAAVNEQNRLQAIQSTDDRWEIDAPLPDLRVMTIEPDSQPGHRSPQAITVQYAGTSRQLRLKPGNYLLQGLQLCFKRFDPDIVLTRWGDDWLFPYLQKVAQDEALPFHPSRDPERPLRSKKASSYFTYGQVIYRGQQSYLYGRFHIDVHNALLFAEYRLEGVLEQARVSGMPVQEMARRSPGAGITAMQMIVALQRGVLVPTTKQQVEHFKSVNELIRADRGGMVFMPAVGLHTDVAEIDFVSMYPSIISQFNISPETVRVTSDDVCIAPEIGIPIDQSQRGLLPETLAPLLAKRIAMKQRLAGWSHYDCRSKPMKARSNALKWLLVVAFGYAGYKRARFGRIEAHEAITAYSREAMLSAKEAAEEAGFEVLHLYVDGLWVKKPGITKEAVAALMAEITRRTRLPIALEGIYRWIAFLPSKLDARIPVPNRYFGAFTDKSLKYRGIEARRHDTPPFIAALQLNILQRLARVGEIDHPAAWLPGIIKLVQQGIAQLEAGQIPLEDLLVSQTLSREVAAYRTPSPAARAAAQLEKAGKQRFPGQQIRFLYVRGEGETAVHAWDLPTTAHRQAIDTQQYTELLLRAVVTVLQPFGIDEIWLRAVLLEQPYQPFLPLFTQKAKFGN